MRIPMCILFSPTMPGESMMHACLCFHAHGACHFLLHSFYCWRFVDTSGDLPCPVRFGPQINFPDGLTSLWLCFSPATPDVRAVKAIQLVHGGRPSMNGPNADDWKALSTAIVRLPWPLGRVRMTNENGSRRKDGKGLECSPQLHDKLKAVTTSSKQF